MIAGLIVSTMVITCIQVFVLPLPSVTVQVTVVLPTGKTPGASLITDATLQLSEVAGDVSEGDVLVQEPGSTL